MIWIPCTPGADERTGATYELKDVIYEKSPEGIARVTINRPERRNAFTPRTVKEMRWCMDDARDDMSVGVVVLRGAGIWRSVAVVIRAREGRGGYVEAKAGGSEETPRLNVLDLQMQIRRMPKPVIASVAGYAVGGGHTFFTWCVISPLRRITRCSGRLTEGRVLRRRIRLDSHGSTHRPEKARDVVLSAFL